MQLYNEAAGNDVKMQELKGTLQYLQHQYLCCSPIKEAVEMQKNNPQGDNA